MKTSTFSKIWGFGVLAYVRDVVTNSGLGGEGRFKSGPFLYPTYEGSIKDSNVSS